MTDSIQNFYTAAHAYCAWAESPRQEASAEVGLALAYLTKIYHCALSLPDVTADDDEEFCPSDEQTRSIYESFGKLPFGYYGECYDPLIVPAEAPSLGDVADDLTDIWSDLKSGVLAYEAHQLNTAVWHWKFYFKIHWGLHAVSALRALHCWSVSNT